ncbi:MAG: HPP family protein, partial [SAR324 cluster bacterium]|nr:HPP family protein [SAR324 cluster bacterium]
FLGIFALGFLRHLVHLKQQDILFLIGSSGALAVLLYGTPGVPLAQPRNLMGGHILSALTGVLMNGWIAEPLYLSGALSVATAIAVMHLTKTTHPPGGATALIAVIGGERVHQLGFLYVLSPVALGALIMLVVALIVNNLTSFRRYPVFWW